MLETLVLENWKSHRHSELSFSEGVNALVGEMGSGKSAVLEGVCFALFGETPATHSRTITKEELIRRHPEQADAARVTLTFTHNGNEYEVERHLSSAKGTHDCAIRKNGDLVEAPQSTRVTDVVEETLGINFDTFTRILYAEQNEMDRFFAMAPAERKEKVDELLRLDRFESARSTAVTLRNRIKDRADNLREDINAMEIPEEETLEELRDTVTDLAEEMEELEAEKEECAEKLDTEQETRAQLEAKQDRFEELKEKRISLSSTIENLAEEIAAKADTLGVDADAIEAETVAEEKETVEEKKAELEALREEKNELENDLSALTAVIDNMEEEKEELAERAAAFETFAEIRDELVEKQKELDALTDEHASLSAEQEQLKETIDALEEAGSTCPVCNQSLSEEHRENVLADARERRDALAEKISALESKAEALQDDVDALKEKRDELLQYKGAAEALEDVEETLAEKRAEQKEKQEKLETLKERFSPEKVAELEEKVEQLREKEAVLEKRAQLEEKEDALAAVEEKREALDFSTEKLEAVRETCFDLEKQIDVLEEKIESAQELKAEKEKRLETLEQERARMEEMRTQIEKHGALADFLSRFLTALEETQVAMRTYFVDAVNEVMQDLWEVLYPYEDYYAIRLNAEKDYIVELQEESGWVPAEGAVSGGERQSAALTLRVALATVLAPSLKLLILDEPTHNLDRTAIDDLGEMLRQKLSGLLEQVFLITHEEALETAATGTLYNLSKKETAHGLTEIEQVS